MEVHTAHNAICWSSEYGSTNIRGVGRGGAGGGQWSENNRKQWTGSKQGDTMISETLCSRHENWSIGYWSFKTNGSWITTTLRTFSCIVDFYRRMKLWLVPPQAFDRKKKWKLVTKLFILIQGFASQRPCYEQKLRDKQRKMVPCELEWKYIVPVDAFYRKKVQCLDSNEGK